MSTAQAIRSRIGSLPRGTPFTSSRFADLGTRGSVHRALSRLTRSGEIERVSRGVFVRPRKSCFVGNVFPAVADVVRTRAKANGETVQVHGAEAVRRLGLSTQVPTVPVFHTSASSRTIRVGDTTVRMIHTSNRRRLQLAGEPAGLALSALWYLGKEGVTPDAVATVAVALSREQFQRLRSAKMPAWMADALSAHSRDLARG